MKYTYKQRVKMAQKLKIFLAIFFAATMFFTGKAILDKTFAADNDYGTATVTFNTGADGQFADGSTTNTVTYNLTKKTIVYSHTPNVEDNGTQNYALSGSGDPYKDTVVIPGATKLHVKVKYAEGRNSFYIYSGVFDNDYPSDNDSLVDSMQDYGLSDIGGTREYDIDSNAVTFFLQNVYDSDLHGDGYGYYAIVSAETDNGVLSLGSIASGEYKEPIGNEELGFSSWSQDLLTLNSNTTLQANYVPKIDSGLIMGAFWILKGNGELLIGRENQTTNFTLDFGMKDRKSVV